jgi:hypothetical protein
MKKKEKRVRVSNRTYPPKLCKKQDCNLEFIPTDARQVYCCSQHRIDCNNDKRKLIDKFESEFAKKAKKNRFVLIKISESDFYKKRGYVEKGLLVYEGYEFPIYHNKEREKETDREILVCYEYGLILLDARKELYKIDLIENKNS